MKNNEKILRYLSDLMSVDEKELFLKELENSQELKSLLTKTQNNLDKIKQLGDVELNKTYSANLLPNARAKIENENKSFLWFKPAYVSAILIVLLVGINLLFIENGGTDYFGDYLADVEDEYIADAIDENFLSDSYNNYIYEEVVDDYFEDIQIGVDDIDGYFDNNLYSEYSFVSELSSEEVDEIYNTLLKTKIL